MKAEHKRRGFGYRALALWRPWDRGDGTHPREQDRQGRLFSGSAAFILQLSFGHRLRNAADRRLLSFRCGRPTPEGPPYGRRGRRWLIIVDRTFHPTSSGCSSRGGARPAWDMRVAYGCLKELVASKPQPP
jgi:hypothetical protein